MTDPLPPPVPPKAPLPPLTLANGTKPENIDAAAVAGQWISKFKTLLLNSSKDYHTAVPEIFHAESWWRDFLALSWDMRSIRGLAGISKFLLGSSNHHEFRNVRPMANECPKPLKPQLVNMGGPCWITAGFTFETNFGEGVGCVYLVNTAVDEWRAWVVHTELETLHQKQPQQHSQSNGAHATNGTAQRHSAATADGTSSSSSSSSYDHTVLIIGAGQSGLALAARLANRGIDYLVLDRNPADAAAPGGGAWTTRYDSVTAHTPSFVDHFPFLSYPEGHPLWPTKKDIVAWQQGYVKKLGLKVRGGVDVESVQRDGNGRGTVWKVRLSDTKDGAGEVKELTCRHVVLATGIISPRPKLPEFPSRGEFKGLVYHTGEHTSAARMLEGRGLDVGKAKIVIVGAGTSAHDIAVDYVLHGVAPGNVTMLQRTPIFSMSRQALCATMFRPYDPAQGGDVRSADLLNHALPSSVLRSVGVGMSMGISEMDKEMLKGLEEKGVRVKRGDDGDGFPDWLLVRIGGFYIDQGANEMILDGRVGVKWVGGKGEDGVERKGVVDITSEGVVVDAGDGRTEVVPADVVVLATGFERCEKLVDELMGEHGEDRAKLGRVGHMDEEGERISWWRQTKLPGWWYMAGSFMWARAFSAVLALQIEALERGLNEEYWQE